MDPPAPQASVTQKTRAVARFGRHALLEICLDIPAANTLENVEIELKPGTHKFLDSIALIHTRTGKILAQFENPTTHLLSFAAPLPLPAGEDFFQIAIVPRRDAPLGCALDAKLTNLTLSEGAVSLVNPDPPGQLTLGLVPAFTDVVSQGQQGIPHFRIPGVAIDKRGTLHAVYDHRHTPGGSDLPGDIDVGYSRSTDGGTTWDPSRAILDFDSSLPGSQGNGVGDPCILYDPQTDTLWVAALWSFGNRGYHGSGPGLEPSETGQYVLTKSEDGGKTWSAPINITKEVKDPGWRLLFQGPGHGLAMRNGTLVFPSQVRDASGTVRVCFIYSADHGHSWHFGSSLPHATPQTNENTVCELDDGRLLFSMRTPTESNGQRAWIHYSPAGAKPMENGVWGPLFRLPAVPDPVCQGSVIQWTSTHRGDPLGLTLSVNCGSPTAREDLTLRVSRDGGATWPVSRLLHPGNSAYSSVCILPDKSIGVLFERENYRKITFARVEASWLMDTAATGQTKTNLGN